MNLYFAMRRLEIEVDTLALTMAIPPDEWDAWRTDESWLED